MSEAPPPPPPGRRRLPPRRIALVLGVWVVVAGAALLIANALDSPAGEGARDEAQAVAPGPVATPGATAEGSLPPLALVLDRPLPDGIGDLPPIRQATRLSELAQSDRDPRRLVELGSVLQLLGQPDNAATAYRAALRAAPGDVAAQAGLAMTEGTDDAGLIRASQELAALAQRHPDDQLVAFNQGWVELYRRRAAVVEQAWRRTVALDPASRLGLTAAELLRQLQSTAGSP